MSPAPNTTRPHPLTSSVCHWIPFPWTIKMVRNFWPFSLSHFHTHTHTGHSISWFLTMCNTLWIAVFWCGLVLTNLSYCSGVRLTKTYDVIILRYGYGFKILCDILKDTFEISQNFEYIHRKIRILLLFCVWFTIYLNCDVKRRDSGKIGSGRAHEPTS